MCGIAGLWQSSLSRGSSDSAAMQAERMSDALAHRGPDDSGLWHDRDSSIALAHRRLSIVDLSKEGHQPMTSADERYVMVFNGEIYNFQTLLHELEALGYPFRGHSDTEVLLAAISHRGLESALSRLNGMFAFALWDRKERTLHLVRDRVGKKPLYFGWLGHDFVFSSELKPFRAVNTFTGELDKTAIGLYLRFGHVPTPHCIYRGLYKLRPGCVFSLKIDDAHAPFDPDDSMVSYWSAVGAARQGIEHPFCQSEAQATDELQSLLQEATAARMVADVPVGAFLSGGIDSSLIVSIMQAQSRARIKTFSLGFEGYASNETPHAKAIAQYLGTEHTEFHVSDQEVIDNVPRIPDIVDEPLADFAQVPNYLISKLARSDVKVTLSGDGGDELFCGYSRSTDIPLKWNKIQRVPRSIRRMGSKLATYALNAQDEQSKAVRTAARLGSASVDELYFHKMSQWMNPSRLVLGGLGQDIVNHARADWPDITDPWQRVQLREFAHLADVILTKVDRTSMACGLEVRSPLLDFRVVEWAWRLPTVMKARGRERKLILRDLLGRYIPKPLFERPKQGFGAPIQQWLEGPLCEWADDLLAHDRLKQQDLLDPEPITRLWQAQRHGENYGMKSTWNMLMLQAWIEADP